MHRPGVRPGISVAEGNWVKRMNAILDKPVAELSEPPSARTCRICGELQSFRLVKIKKVLASSKKERCSGCWCLSRLLIDVYADSIDLKETIMVNPLLGGGGYLLCCPQIKGLFSYDGLIEVYRKKGESTNSSRNLT